MDLNDEDDFDMLDPMARAAAERKMERRDKRDGRADGGPGRKGRSRAPAFLQSDSEDSDGEAALLERRRRRNVYDEVQPVDGVFEGGEDELPLEQLSDIKANSIKEWIETEAVKKTIMREFRNFLMTYVDDHGTSVYGQRIKALGEGELRYFPQAGIALRRVFFIIQPTPNLCTCPSYIFPTAKPSWPTSSPIVPLQCSPYSTK
jgi:DNA replication licensing factor MCM2